jgi:hypothetical protein
MIALSTSFLLGIGALVSAGLAVYGEWQGAVPAAAEQATTGDALGRAQVRPYGLLTVALLLVLAIIVPTPARLCHKT